MKTITGIFLLLALASALTTLSAQSTGNVGINMPNPTATLHIKANGSSSATQALKVDDSNGTNLLTINNDGTVSGTAAVNLSSGTVGAPKAAGIFSTLSTRTSDGYLSPSGNGLVSSGDPADRRAFNLVAQTVPFTAVLSAVTVSLTIDTFTFLQRPLKVELYVNGSVTPMNIIFPQNVLVPATTYISVPVITTVTVQRGDLIAYRVSNFPSGQINCSVTIKYSEQ